MLPQEWVYLASGTIQRIISLGSADAITEPFPAQIGVKARKGEALVPRSQFARESKRERELQSVTSL